MSGIVARGGAAVRTTARGVPIKPIMSANRMEAKRAVLNLYKQWHRAVPNIITLFQLPYTPDKCRAKIREEFLKNSHVRDVRVIDLLLVKGQMDLQETLSKWKQSCHVKEYFDKSTDVQEPSSFMGKFLK